MAESPSETSYDELSEQYAAVREALIWNSAIVSILLRQAGGEIEIDRETLESINVSDIETEVRYDAEKDMYVVRRADHD